MKKLIGLFLIVIGLVLGFYVGFYLCFIGGIVDVIATIKSPSPLVSAVAIGVLKIMFSGFAGWVSGAAFIIPGAVMLKSK